MAETQPLQSGTIDTEETVAASRFPSPGFLYNAGDAAGLAVGLGIALAHARGSSGDAISAFLFGDVGAAALTIATIVFFGSGFAYAKAWRESGAAHIRLVRVADSISTVGAIMLGVSIFMVGQPLLATVSAAAHALGKLGSAIAAGDSDARTFNCSCRWLVLGSRALGLAACLPVFIFDLGPDGPAYGSAILMSATLVLCYLAWIWADFLLIEDAD